MKPKPGIGAKYPVDVPQADRRNEERQVDLELKGHVAVVTGGASGIGRACVQGLAREGCRVAIWDISADVKDSAIVLTKDFGSPSLGVIVDVSDYAAVQEAARRRKALWANRPSRPCGGDRIRQVRLPVHQSGPVRLAARAEHEHHGHGSCRPRRCTRNGPRRSGTMVFIASVAGQIGSPTDPPYSASKAANINFAQCLAKDMAQHNVRVNTVYPGMVQTPLNRAVWQAWNDQQPPEPAARTRIGRETKCAPSYRWVAGRSRKISRTWWCFYRRPAPQVTGQTINVDGGHVMHW